jgi:hypothetical protein
MGKWKIMSYEDWLKVGLLQGWCGPSVCSTHDGVPTSLEEDDAYDDGEDPCIHVLRLYEDAAQKVAVEENHSPSTWRATNSGYKI